MGNNNWKITCLHYGTLSCYKSLFDGGLDQVRYPFVYSGYLLQKDNRNILVDTGVHQDNIIDGKAWANSPAEGGNQYVLDALAREGLTPMTSRSSCIRICIMTTLAVCCCSRMRSICSKETNISTCSIRYLLRRFAETMTHAHRATLPKSRISA